MRFTLSLCQLACQALPQRLKVRPALADEPRGARGCVASVRWSLRLPAHVACCLPALAHPLQKPALDDSDEP